MGYQATYDGIQLDNFMGILKVKRTILPPRENFSRKIPSIHGEVYTGFTYAAKTISLDCYILAENYNDHMEKLRIIADVLNVDSPRKMTISDEEDKHFYAVLDGAVDVERIGYHGQFTLTFLLHNPYTYASETHEIFADEHNILSVENSGNVPTQPTVMVGFHNTAHYCQITNYTGETVLVGQRPSVDKPTSTGDEKVVYDQCTTLENWTPAGNVVDSGREVMGSMRVNAGGYAFIPADFGTSDKGWHGACYRRNIGRDITDFKVDVCLEHNSMGSLMGTGATTTPPPQSAKFVITASPSTTIRADRGTSYKQLGTVKKGVVVDVTSIMNNWGKITYNGVTGYISLNHAKKYVAPTPPSNVGTYEATTNVQVRTSPSQTKGHIITTAKKGTKYTMIAKDSNGWFRCTINGKTGYTYSKYWKKVTSTARTPFSRAVAENETPSAENRMGKVEIYGFDKHGAKLFKFELSDDEEWFEYTKPSVQIGNEVVLSDNKSTPTPKTKTEKDEDGKSVTKKVNSGKYGDWNDLRAWFRISRTTNEKGEQVWNTRIERVEGNEIVKTIKSNSLVKSTYPKTDLNHIVVWFGQYKDKPAVDLMSFKHLDVYDKKPVKPEENFPIFRKGDELRVDFEEQMIYLNDRYFMDYVDIGSEFFSNPQGESEFIVATDDTEADIYASIQEKWL